MINLVTLQERLENLSENFQKETFLFDLLSIYELPKSTISLLSKNPSKLSGKADQIILKNKVLFHVTTLEEDEHIAIDALQKDKNSYKYNPRFIIVTDFVTLLAIDTKTNETLDIQVKDLGKHYAFFLPWCGMEKSQHINENPADIRAAYKMDKLYQAIVSDNTEHYRDHSHDLNIFLSRLLFCFFAEDTGIFEKEGIFTNLVDSQTSENGDGLKDLFATLFTILNTEESKRSGFASHFLEFPYVNGGLFETEIHLPTFTSTSRKLIIECGKLDWSSINPDIFGSMIQAVVHPGQRENLGMHYTSVPNIMKVIEPLFLNDLYSELDKSKNDFNKLTKLRERISKIRIFDPACGSGNFLIISYKELCKLEIQIIKHLDLQDSFASQDGWNNTTSGITLNNFFGIEIDDFAHQIAKLSLYLAQHQVNQQFEKEFGKLKPILPLKESGVIKSKNATRIKWDDVCNRKDQFGNEYEIYVVGNPPFEGSRKQQEQQKLDIKNTFESITRLYKSLDYVAIWYFRMAEYISGFKNIKGALVSTNSVTQGEQVSLLWPLVYKSNIEIFFAYQSFKWSNLAKKNAGVTCVIIGFRNIEKGPKRIYVGKQYISVDNINPYLVEGKFIEIYRRKKPLSRDLPPISFGNMPNDGGHLLLDQSEYIELVEAYPEAKKVIKKATGSFEFINGVSRYCIWVDQTNLCIAEKIPPILRRFELTKSHRLNSKDKGTNKLASRPNQFRDLKQAIKSSIIIPSVSSERRTYIPIGILGSDTIVTNSAQVIYDSEVYVFAIVTSQIHMAWVRAVSGRLKTDLRYSAEISYNSFPFPNITDKQKESLTTHVYNILEEREKYPEKTMADLYDPDKMPVGLREAHKYLDQAVDQLYRSKPFESAEERLAHLFKLYEEMITSEAKK